MVSKTLSNSKKMPIVHAVFSEGSKLVELYWKKKKKKVKTVFVVTQYLIMMLMRVWTNQKGGGTQVLKCMGMCCSNELHFFTKIC